jgi:hypothetical protein
MRQELPFAFSELLGIPQARGYDNSIVVRNDLFIETPVGNVTARDYFAQKAYDRTKLTPQERGLLLKAFNPAPLKHFCYESPFDMHTPIAGVVQSCVEIWISDRRYVAFNERVTLNKFFTRCVPIPNDQSDCEPYIAANALLPRIKAIA